MTTPTDRPAPSPTDKTPELPRQLTQAMLIVQGLLLSSDDVDGFLAELAGVGAAVIDPAASCGITTRYDGRPITVASSDDRAAALDETQYADAAGPCLHAMVSGQTIYVPDVAVDARWPEFMEVARSVGLQSSLSIPLIVQGEAVGAMNFYAFHRQLAFDLAHQTAAAIFAAQAAGALQLLLRRTRDAVLVGQLEKALSSRSVIDQAMGVVMAQQHCTSVEAFAILRARSQSSQRKLRDVAAELLAEIADTGPVEQLDADRQTARPAGLDIGKETR